MYQGLQKYSQKGRFVILFSDVTKNLFYDKRCVFSKKLTWRKLAEIGQKLDFRAFYSEF